MALLARPLAFLKTLHTARETTQSICNVILRPSPPPIRFGGGADYSIPLQVLEILQIRVNFSWHPRKVGIYIFHVAFIFLSTKGSRVVVYVCVLYGELLSLLHNARLAKYIWRRKRYFAFGDDSHSVAKLIPKNLNKLHPYSFFTDKFIRKTHK